MRKFFILVIALLATAVSPIFTSAPSHAGEGNAAQIEELLAMSPADRRAYLKALPQEERHGLWFELKRTEAMRNGQAPAKKGDGMTPHKIQSDRSASRATRDVGTIVYDDNNVQTVFGGGAIIGNRFNTHTGNPVLASGTVDTVQAVVVEGPAFSSSSAGFVLLGPQTTGGGAIAIFSTFTAPAPATTTTVTFSGIGASYTGSSFFVLFGDFASIHIPAFGTGSNSAQGFHGVVGYTGGMGPNITSTFDFGGARNGLVRSSGNILTSLPVELMKFEVE